MVCLRNISVDTLHKGETKDNNNNNNNNNSNTNKVDTLVGTQGNIVKKNASQIAAKFIQAEYGLTEKRPSAPQFYVYIAYNAFSLRTYDNFRPLDLC
jgi:hypothetical protein